jgi:hypothetical protein
MTDGSVWRRMMDRGFTEAAPLDPGSNGRLYRVSDHSIKCGHISGKRSEGEIKIFD